MVKQQVILMQGIKILFIIIFLLGLGGGCSATGPHKKKTKKGVMDDVLSFRDLQQIDLDKDGRKEIIAIYATGVNSSGIKVIKFDKDRENIIFERIFNTPDTKFGMKKGIPTVTFEEIDQANGRRVKGAYYWDGKTFILEQK